MKFLESIVILAVWTLVRSAAGGMTESPILNFAAEAAAELESKAGQEETEVTEMSERGETESEEIDSTADDSKSEAETEDGTNFKTETETEAGNETEPDAETDEETNTETETDADTETGADTETDTGTEADAETGTETETETETEMRIIWISDLRVAFENGCKYYDGTTEVPLEAEIQGLPEGMNLNLQGVSASGDAGVWPVEVQAVLEGEESETYQVVFESDPLSETAEPLTVTILPRPLRVEISDARKPYFSENLDKNLIFSEDMPVTVSGFMKDGQETDEIPEGFELPEITIDETVLQKDSPMYRNGEEIEYENALILSTDKEGNFTGNPTGNYCFRMDSEEYFRGGTVVLSAPALVGTLDYSVRCTLGASWQDAQGRFWIREGGSILVEPVQGKGFTEGAEFSSLTVSGTGEFRLTKRDAKGELLAESQTRSISWYTDGQAPTGGLDVNGAALPETNALALSGTAEVKVSDLSDSQSGTRTVQMLIVEETQAGQTGEALYAADPSAWTAQNACLLTKEGTWRVFVRLEDQVGNVRYLKSGSILIDKTAPEIRITGVTPGSANNGTVALEVFLGDLHLDSEQVQLTLRGSKNGERQVSWQGEEGEEGLFFRTEDLPRSREWDDLYTLTVRAMDQAGNQAEEILHFSVNRFGSVLKIDEKTKEGIAGYYIRTPTSIVIREINVDELMTTRISVGYEGKIRILYPGRDYQVEKRGTANTWKEYCYRIPASVFSQEGRYYVLCSSRDRASNETDNRLQKQKLEFAVDRTAPTLIATGIENRGVYEGESKTLYLECRDNLALKQVSVWLGDKLLSSGDRQEQEFTLLPEDSWQELRFLAVDRAGNAMEEQKLWFWLGNQEPDVLPAEAEQQAQRTFLETETEEQEREAARILLKQVEKDKSGVDAQKMETGEAKFADSVKAAAGIAVFTVIAVILYRLKTAKL